MQDGIVAHDGDISVRDDIDFECARIRQPRQSLERRQVSLAVLGSRETVAASGPSFPNHAWAR